MSHLKHLFKDHVQTAHHRAACWFETAFCVTPLFRNQLKHHLAPTFRPRVVTFSTKRAVFDVDYTEKKTLETTKAF